MSILGGGEGQTVDKILEHQWIRSYFAQNFEMNLVRK